MRALQPAPGGIDPARCRWLLIDQSREEVVTLVVIGGIVGERAEELWATVEYALEVAADRLVRLDLTQAVGFDIATMDFLRSVARTASRRCDNLEIVLQTGSPLQQYSRGYGLSPTPKPGDETELGSPLNQPGRARSAARELVRLV